MLCFPSAPSSGVLPIISPPIEEGEGPERVFLMFLCPKTPKNFEGLGAKHWQVGVCFRLWEQAQYLRSCLPGTLGS